MREILCLSTSNYDPFPTRKQNVMNRMTDARVLYINPPITWLAPLKDPSLRKDLFKGRAEGQRKREHLEVFSLPPVHPLHSRYRRINRLNQRKLARQVKRLLAAKGFGRDFYIWCYSPASADFIPALARELGLEEADLWRRTIYDCVDRHAAYPGLLDPAVVDGMEEDLARQAAWVFATARGLYERLLPFNPRTHLVPNGVDLPLFSSVEGIRPREDRPLTFGFVGMMQDCIDMDSLLAVADHFPQGRLVWAGRALPGVDLKPLEARPNFHALGLIPQQQLPAVMADFHVCLNVFVDNELSRQVSPLKFYEYLATGKPVVSTPVPFQVRDYARCIYLAEGPEQMAAACREALAEEAGDPRKKMRMEGAAAASWEVRVAEMRRILGW